MPKFTVGKYLEFQENIIGHCQVIMRTYKFYRMYVSVSQEDQRKRDIRQEENDVVVALVHVRIADKNMVPGKDVKLNLIRKYGKN